MKKVLSFLVGLIGFHFIPENHKAAVMRLGMYHRARGPGFIWIIPFVERVENIVKIGMRFATFLIKQVLSNDGIPLDFELTVIYNFDPDSTSRPIAAQLVRLPDHILENIVREYADKSLRQAVAQHSTEAICTGGAIADIERDVIEGLQARIRHLGLAPMADGGMMIKEITPRKDFLESILATKGYEMILKVLTGYPIADVDQALLAELVRGFKDAPPRVLSSFSELLRFPRAERSDEQ